MSGRRERREQRGRRRTMSGRRERREQQVFVGPAVCDHAVLVTYSVPAVWNGWALRCALRGSW